MSRDARAKSQTGIYHIMLRGIDKRNIFLDDEDRMKFLDKLMKSKEVANFNLYGYCLMDNHVHLLIGEKEDIGTSIKRITVGYVQWHNKKYDRTGHLFQNRYMSEVVESEGYLINVLRYIHLSPVKAKITKLAKDYWWSSYNQYILAYQDQNSYIDAQLIKSYYSRQNDFEVFMNTKSEEEFLECKTVKKYSDIMLKTFLQKEYDLNRLIDITVDERNQVIKDIYKTTGASIRQLERIMGIGRAIIEKAIK